MNCQQATHLLSDAQERELPIKDRAALKFHVTMCSGCRNFGKQMETLRDIAKTYAKGKDFNGLIDSEPAKDDHQDKL